MKTRTKKAVKRLLGGAISVALSLAMALCIFAGTGIEVRAAKTWSVEEYNLQDTTLDQFNQDSVTVANEDLSEVYNWVAAYLNKYQSAVVLFVKGNPGEIMVCYYGKYDDGDYVVYYQSYSATEDGFKGVQKHVYTKSLNCYILKEGAISASTDASESAQTETSQAPHTHSYAWETVQEVTAEQDGVEEYRCSCGDVQARCVLPRYMAIVKGLYGAVKDTPQNGTAVYDTGSAFTMTDYVIQKLAERSDVTTVVTFKYQGQSYRMTIPAGADYTGLLADEEYFYGYFYFADVVGATIEAL